MLFKAILTTEQDRAYRLRRERRRLEVLRHVGLCIEVAQSIRVRDQLTRRDLVNPAESAWHTLVASRSDNGFIDAMGINVNGFETLARAFAPHYEVRVGPGRRGRPTAFTDKKMALGCLLHFYRSQSEYAALCEIFGVPRSTLSRCLHRAEQALHRALKQVPEARIAWPSFEQQRIMAERVELRHPLLRGRFGFCDGKNYNVQNSGDPNRQNADYNGISFVCTHRTFFLANFSSFCSSSI